MLTQSRTLLVGGLSTVHDPLCAAALSGLGFRATPLHPRTDEGMSIAQALGKQGQCNPAHYAVGAVVEHARASGCSPEEFASRHAWLTVGSCGPCRLAAFGLEYDRVLQGAGLGKLPVVLLDQIAFPGIGESGRLRRLRAEHALALVRAIVAGDVVAALVHSLRPYARDPAEVDDLFDATIRDLASCFERLESPVCALMRARDRAAALGKNTARVLPRVLLVGEPWTTLADGDPSYDLARRLAVAGAEVEVPSATDWLRYRIWERVRGIGAGCPPDHKETRALRRVDARLRTMWRRMTNAAGLGRPRLADFDELASLASPHYDPSVRGGSSHLEVARSLLAVRDRKAHVVLSIKPFGCLPSSSLSDGLLSVLLREQTAVTFLALKTTGSADPAAESRVEVALHDGTLQAQRELIDACEAAGISPAAALAMLEEASVRPLSRLQRRAFACTAAELVWRARRKLKGRLPGAAPPPTAVARSRRARAIPPQERRG